jgi:hypothetical protein
MTRDEMKLRDVAAMGEALGEQYTILFQEVTALHLYWKEFFELFGTNDKRIDRLNRAAPGFFQMLQEQQFETNMLHMARLTDPPKSVGKDNLTICNLPNLVDPSLKPRLTTLIDEAKKRTEFCRDWRNRRFAHHDLLLATQDAKAVPLKSATKENINAALGALADVLNAIEHHYYKNVCVFGAIAPHKGAATLLHVLGFGVKAREKMQQLIARGKVNELDAPESI